MSASSPVSSAPPGHDPTMIGELSGFAGQDTHDAGWHDTPTVDVDARLDPAGDEERRKKSLLAGDVGAAGIRLLLPKLVAPMYAEWGKGRGCLGVVQQLTPWANLEIKTAVVDGVHQPERSKRRVDNAWPTWTELFQRFFAFNDHLLMLDVKAWGAELRLVMSGNRLRQSYDLQALGEEVPKRSAAAASEGATGSQAPHPLHFWCDRVEQKGKLQISLGPNQQRIRQLIQWSMGPLCHARWFAPYKNKLASFNDIILSRSMATFCYGSEKRIALKSPISSLEHRQRLVRREAPQAPETTLAWGRRLFNAYIRCVDRYDADGEITFWPKRVCAKYWHGIESEKLFSPYNIVRLTRYQEYLFEKKTQIYGSVLAQVKSRELLCRGLKWFIEGVLHLPYPKWLNVNGVGESILSREPMFTAHFAGTVRDGADVVCVKATYERALKQESHSNLRMVNNAMIGRDTRRQATLRKIATTSYVPRTVHLADGQTRESVVPQQLARNVHNPLQLDYSALVDELDLQKGITLLNSLRKQQREAARAAKQLALSRSDEQLVITTVFEDHERQQKASTPLSTDPLGWSADCKVQYSNSEELHLEAQGDQDAVLQDRRLITKCTTTANTSKFARETIAVRGHFKADANHRLVLRDIKLALELTLSDDHSHEHLNARLESYGKILGPGHPLPTLDTHVKLGRREIKLEATLSAERWEAIKARVMNPAVSPEWDDKLPQLKRLRKELRQAQNKDDEVNALGRFICRDDQPRAAIAWLAELMDQDRFAISDRSTSDAVTQLESKHKALYNTYWHARPSCANAQRTVKEGICEADKLRQEAEALRDSLQRDAYLRGEALERGRSRCNELIDSLNHFMRHTHLELAVTPSQMRTYLIEQGIQNAEDRVCASAFHLEKYLDTDIRRLKEADQSHFNALERRVYRADLGRLEAIKQALSSSRSQGDAQPLPPHLAAA